ncbi:MAG: hypothetical protein K9K30_07125 [Burkholderiaceae bacterium]|nr:hypothetical protein [Burkholderiaceae bacterium]MCF8184596.1 hypothetical protein [Polynucleobacter sp.]
MTRRAMAEHDAPIYEESARALASPISPYCFIDKRHYRCMGIIAGWTELSKEKCDCAIEQVVSDFINTDVSN